MGINVVLEGENGEHIDTVFDSHGAIGLLASAAHHDPSYRLLRYLDPYGDAVFNWLQVSDLLADLQLAGSLAWSDAERSTLAQVVALVARILEEPRLYVRFMGD
jgi:hypothetical protein